MTADLDDLRKGLAEALYAYDENARNRLAPMPWASETEARRRPYLARAEIAIAGPLAPLITKAESADAYALVLADCVAALTQVPLGLLPGCVDMMVVSALGAPLPGDRARAEIIAAADRIRAAATARADRLAAEVEALRAEADEALRKAIRAWSKKLHIPVTRMMSRALRDEFAAASALAADKADKPEGSR